MSTQSKATIVIASGVVLGLLAVVLAFFGNPDNMSICAACFVRDVAGGLKLHTAPPVQYMRPEVFAIIAGAFIAAVIAKDYKAQAGSATGTRFVLGFTTMIGALTFLGCPTRAVIRLAGGDLNALIGLFGFAAGIFVATRFLNRGFTLGEAKEIPKTAGFAIPAFLIFFFILFLIAPTLFGQSTSGPASMHAPIIVSLVVALVVGWALQKSRLCFSGAFRDIFIANDWGRFGIIAIFFAVILVYNLIVGKFNFGFENQPVAHSDHLWNFIGLFVVGFGAVLATGCPLRQLVKAGQGDADAGVNVLGMLIGAAFAHNFGLAASGAGTTSAGQIAVLIALAVNLCIAFNYSGKGANV